MGAPGAGSPAPMLKRSMWQGLVAGTAGAAVMLVTEKLEQRLTGRPDSHVPGLALLRLTGGPDRERAGAANLVMHFGQGALTGVVRALMANAGLRGPVPSAMFAVVRLSSDQVIENATGVGAPPQTWPRRELAVDLAHKAVYAFTTGVVADALAARRGPGPGQVSAARHPGRRSDVPPLPREAAATR